MKRFILVLVLSCFLLLLFGSVSFAVNNSIDYTGSATFNFNGNVYDFCNELFLQYYNIELGEVPITSTSSGTNQTNYENFLNQLTLTNYRFIQFKKLTTSSSNQLIIWFVNINSSGYLQYKFILQNTNTFRVDKNSSSTSNYNLDFTLNTASGYRDLYLIDTNNSFTNLIFYKAIGNESISPSLSIKYISNKNTLITINVNGSNQSFIKANYNLNGWINIGYIQNYENYNELQGYFGVYSGQSNVDNANYYDTIANFQYNKSINKQYTNNLRVDYDNGYIYLNSAICSYNHGYSLYFTGDGTDTTEIKYYYFVPIDSSLISGDINNDNPTNLDFDFINSIEYISQYNSGNNEIIIDEIFKSGDNIFGLVYDDDNFDNWRFWGFC